MIIVCPRCGAREDAQNPDPDGIHVMIIAVRSEDGTRTASAGVCFDCDYTWSLNENGGAS